MIKRGNRLALLLVGFLTAGVAAAIGPAPPAATAEQLVSPQDGWRFAVADDSSQGIDKALGDRFARLRPKTFRFQVAWNASNFQDQKDRAQALINQAKAQGVQEIIVTFRGEFGQNSHYQPHPTKQYRPAVEAFVKQFADQVDVWGPANEPNAGYAWLPKKSGAKKLAKYYKQLKAVQEQYDPSALLLSPEFHDYGKGNKKRLRNYIDQYVDAGGGFGDVIGWHPYGDLNRKPHPSSRSTADFLNVLSQYPNARSQKVWITEVGAFGKWHDAGKESLKAQNKRVKWLVGPHGFLKFHRITRVYYYHMRAIQDEPWDSGLTSAASFDADPSPRPAWHTWCAASHGGNVHHEDCR